MYKRTFNPCDECKYGIDRRDGSGSDRMCKICEFSELLNRRTQPENEPLTCEGCTYFEDDYEFDPCRGCKRLVRANDYYRRKPERSEG